QPQPVVVGLDPDIIGPESMAASDPVTSGSVVSADPVSPLATGPVDPTAGSFPATPTAATPPGTAPMDPLSSDPATARGSGGRLGLVGAAGVTAARPMVEPGDGGDPQESGEAVPVVGGFAGSAVGEAVGAPATDSTVESEGSIDPFAPVAMGGSPPNPVPS